jgi:AraC family transcriptional regulator
LSYRLIFRSPLVTVSDHVSCTCRAGRHEGGEPRKVVLVRRGFYTIDGAGEKVLVDGLSAAVYDGFSSYDVDYPHEGGCDVTQIEAGPDLLDEAFTTDRYHIPFSPWTSLKHLRLYARIRNADAPPEDIEEAAVDLLSEISAAAGRGGMARGPGVAVRRRLDAVRALMISEPEVNHQLSDLARVAGCSPFHFARLFRQETGFSVRGYRVRLRLAFAASQMLEGADDLAAVAMDAGFSHHSHMTAAFRNVLGIAPRDLRAELHARRYKPPRLRAA